MNFGDSTFLITVMASCILLLAAVARPQGPPTPAAETQGKTAHSSPRQIKVYSAVAAQLVYSVYPRYPKEAKKKHLEGNVQVRYIVDADGSVKDAQAVNGNPILGKAAMEAIRQWRYRPALLNGEPAAVNAEIEMRFHRHKWLVDSEPAVPKNGV